MVTHTEGTEAQLKARGKGMARQDVPLGCHAGLAQDVGLWIDWNMQEGAVDPDIFDSFVSGSPAEDDACDRYLQDVPLNAGSYYLWAAVCRLRPDYEYTAAL